MAKDTDKRRGKRSAIADVVTREYTVHLKKYTYGKFDLNYLTFCRDADDLAGNLRRSALKH